MRHFLSVQTVARRSPPGCHAMSMTALPCPRMRAAPHHPSFLSVPQTDTSFPVLPMAKLVPEGDHFTHSAACLSLVITCEQLPAKGLPSFAEGEVKFHSVRLPARLGTLGWFHYGEVYASALGVMRAACNKSLDRERRSCSHYSRIIQHSSIWLQWDVASAYSMVNPLQVSLEAFTMSGSQDPFSCART